MPMMYDFHWSNAKYMNPSRATTPLIRPHQCASDGGRIGLYRDVWIAAIASSRKSLATQTAAICVRFHGRRVRHVYVTMQITFLARKSALIYRRGLRQRVASLTIDCNGVFAIRAYNRGSTVPSTMSFEAITLRVPGNYINCHEDSEINDHTRAVPIILMHSYDISSE